MSRGVVLWPDAVTNTVILDLWDALAAAGVPAMGRGPHAHQVPHVSLIVAEHLDVHDVLNVVGPTPARPIELRIESAGIFPEGNLFLACVASIELLEEQRRVHEAITPLATSPWPYFEPGTWTPHVTTAWSLTHTEQALALPLVLERLPVRGWLELGGVEDGTTGERWPAGH